MKALSGLAVGFALWAAVHGCDAAAQTDIKVELYRGASGEGWPTPQVIKSNRIEYRGGLGFKFKNCQPCGGYSGLSLHEDDLTLISDKGHWLDMKLKFEGNLPTGIEWAQQRLLPGYDTSRAPETLRKRHSDRRFLVSFEDNTKGDGAHSSNVLAWVDKQTGEVQQIPLLGIHEKLTRDKGLEAVALWSDDSMLLLAEGDYNATSTFAWHLSKGNPSSRTDLAWPIADKYRPTDAVALKDGGALILERRFIHRDKDHREHYASARLRWLTATEMTCALRRGTADQSNKQCPVKADKALPSLSSHMLLELRGINAANGAVSPVDNMEGLDVRCDNKRRLWIYMISDDNLNPIEQKTVLLTFESKNDALNKAAC